jgi:Flp pilus assembly protein TadG
MHRFNSAGRPRRAAEGGQIVVIAALAMIVMIAFGALVLEGGNAYAQQRVVQNGADSIADAGAVRLGQKLAGVATVDGDVLAVMNTSATANRIDSFIGRYTDVTGKYLDTSGTVVTDPAAAARVGAGTIPPNTQGVSVGGTRNFPTFLGRAVGFNSFDASADATAITGRLAGGLLLPIVLPVSIVDCDTNGSLGSVPEDEWQLSQPPVAPATTPNGTEYIIPLCKTGGGSFQVLDLDPSLRCDDEVADPPFIEWDLLPVIVDSDNGNNCAKPITDYVNDNLHFKTVLIPICDNAFGSEPCGTEGGSRATYRITRLASFFIDYMDDTNNRNNSKCQGGVGSTGQPLVSIAGNGSSSCIVGWFVRWFKSGPVGSGPVGNSDAIGVQLIK